MKYQRCQLLFRDDLTTLQQAKVILFGVGGVGSFCLDALIRTGICDVTIVDFDTYDETNQNRQIGSDLVGAIKVERLRELYPTVTPIHVKVTPQWIENFDFDPYDVVLDAIDDISAKVALALKCHKKLISATGSAKRIDPTKIEVATIWKTQGDALAKKFRDELKKKRFSKNFRVIFSQEQVLCTEKGSFVGVTGAFGLTLCAEAIKKILERAKTAHL